MAIVKMNKLSVIGLNDEKHLMLRDLMKLGCVEISNGADKLSDEELAEIVEKDGDEENAVRYDKLVANAASALKILDKYAGPKGGLFKTRKQISKSQYKELQKTENKLAEKVTGIVALNESLQGAYAEENNAKAQIAALKPWRNYDLSMGITETARLKIRFGVASPLTDVAQVSKELEEAGLACELTEISRDNEQCYLSLWHFKEDESQVMDIMRKYGYNNSQMEQFKRDAASNIARLEKRIGDLEVTKEKLITQIKEKASWREDVEIYHDMMAIKRDEFRIRDRLLKTEKTFAFDGWIPADSTIKLGKTLDRYTCWSELSEPDENDDIPVRIKNSKFVTPFEFITEMYSLPNAREIDPTAIFTIFYIIFFGIMFGDIGYGLIILIGTIAVLKKYKLYEGGAYKLMKVLMWSGISSTFWGVMFGSFFGDLIPVLTGTFFGNKISIKPLWLDPASEPMIFLAFSCGLGVVHLFIGMGIKGYQLIKDGQVLMAIKDVLAWYCIVLGLVLWIFGGMVFQQGPFVGKILTIAGGAMAIVIPIIISKGIGKAMGLWDLYSGITGNLSDILSYSRLLGLGLASTSIAQVFNFLASMGGKGVAGVAMFVVIGLLGHTLNFGVNALGAFVHSCRLQYVEFFGRFYEGGGRELKPFENETKYIKIQEEEK